MKRITTIMMFIILLAGCAQNKGSFMDFAAIKNAERTMIKMNSAMEQYYVEEGAYPPQNVSFEDELKPYFISFNRDNEPIDKWPEMVEEVFKDGELVYESRDPETTYFIYGRAKDSENTVVFCRPALPHTEEETKE